MILITGTSGFIGKHLLRALIKKEGRDNVLALTSSPITDCDYLLHNNYTFEPAFFEQAGYNTISTVIHAGAFTPKKGSEADLYQASLSNILSTANLLTTLPKSLEKFILLSTLDVYATKAQAISEHDTVQPTSLYGHSKYYCEKMLESWAKEKNKTIQVLRIGHVYGPGEEAYKKVIPVTIKRMHAKLPPQIWGTGKELRSFIYIDDVVNAVMNAISLNIYQEPINVVSEYAYSIQDIVHKLIEVSGVSMKPEYIPSHQVGRDFVFDNSKMKSLLGGENATLEEGLRAEWNYMYNLK